MTAAITAAIALVLGFILGVLGVFGYAFWRGRKKTWDTSNIVNAVRFMAHCILHSDDFTKMYYADGTRPFYYLELDEFSQVVKTRPNEEK